MNNEKLKDLLRECPRPWSVERHCDHHPARLKENCPQVWIRDAKNRTITAISWNVDAMRVAEALISMVNED